jgi:hypothetical protein
MKVLLPDRRVDPSGQVKVQRSCQVKVPSALFGRAIGSFT